MIARQLRHSDEWISSGGGVCRRGRAAHVATHKFGVEVQRNKATILSQQLDRDNNETPKDSHEPKSCYVL
jgi:hypothetical protein